MLANNGRDGLADGQFYGFEWKQAPLGAVATWSDPLCLWTSHILRSALPGFLTWGDDQIILFNRAYSDLLGPAISRCSASP